MWRRDENFAVRNFRVSKGIPVPYNLVMMVHTRETRASASEIKFLIEPQLAPRIREWARTHMEPDPHGTGPFGDEYETTSLYFDTRRYDVLHRRASFGRAKYRVRRYGNGSSVFLERKLRKPGVLIKRRTAAPVASLDRLQRPDAPFDWPGGWFHQRLLLRRLEPVCQVSYHRTARNVHVPDGVARLTLDSQLGAAVAQEIAFTPEAAVPFLEHRLILELKYRRQLPAIFRRLVEEFALAPETASKYRLGMSALGHAPASDRPVVAGHADASYA
jgi:VTC domain